MLRFADIWAQPWQRRGLIALIIVVLYGAVGFLLAPWLIERTLTSTLSERLSLSAQVGDLQLNPFSLSLRVDELKVDEAIPELATTSRNMETLRQLAGISRGAAIEAESAAEISELLDGYLDPDSDQPVETSYRTPAGINGWVLGILLMCISADWVCRKLWGMV